MINGLKKIAKKYIVFLKRLILMIRGKKLICVYQMCKVGSQSVEYGLRRSGVEPLLFFHYVNDLKREKFLDYLILICYKKLKLNIQIVSPIRNPIFRSVSSFSHDFISLRGKGNCTGYMQNHSIDELEEFYFNVWTGHGVPDRWISKELNPFIGVDLYENNFDKNRRTMLLKKNNIELLVFDSVLSDKKKAELISSFLERKITINVVKNTHMDRTYKGNYQEFKDYMLSNERYLKLVKDSRFYNQFYVS